jgi:uncharacterized protein YgbK (DUF1537 family)
MNLSLAHINSALPPVPTDNYGSVIRQLLAESQTVTVVLDDDPTGTQTVHDIAVLTNWEVELLKEEFDRQPVAFYILTNSRALPEAQAIVLNKEVAQNVREAARQSGVSFSIVSRSDSTLRGHFPAEPATLTEALDWQEAVWVLAPALFEAGRYTYQDVHYVQEGEELIPAAETPFALDPAFGFRHSHLAEWVEEKTKGSISAREVKSFGVETIRTTPVEELVRQLGACLPGSVCLLNAMDYADLDKMSLALRLAERQGKRFLYRSAGSLVRSLCGIPARPLLRPEALVAASQLGGLVVMGSYVKKSSAQLQYLKANTKLVFREVSVAKLLEEGAGQEIGQVAREATRHLTEGRTVVIYTSRELLTGPDKTASLEIGQKVSSSLVEITRSIQVRPAFIVAKGGITSSDLATQALNIKRARVAGQISAGVPVWMTGPESLFPEMPYIVFPGNVGTEQALAELVAALDQAARRGGPFIGQ